MWMLQKAIQINNLLISCSNCNNFYHSKCSKISFENFQRTTSWSCDYCITKILPFYNQKNEELFLTMQAKEDNFGEHINLIPSFTIQTLLDNISGEGWNNEDNYIFDLTHSQYYTPSEFLSSKFPKESFSMFHINIASLSFHLDDLKMLLSILDYPFDIIAISETKLRMVLNLLPTFLSQDMISDINQLNQILVVLDFFTKTILTL